MATSSDTTPRPARWAKAVPLLALSVAIFFSACAVGVRRPASEVTTTSATLQGKVLSTTGGLGAYYMEYGPIRGQTEQTPRRPIDFVVNESHAVSEPVTELDPGTTYRFAVCAEDMVNWGDAFCSPEQTFTTRPTGDFLTGTGRAVGVDFTATIHGDANGQNPSGFFTARSEASSSQFNFDGTPTCLNVTGGASPAATGGYRIDTGAQAGQGFMAAIRDNGGSAADQGLWLVFLPDPPTDCPAPGDPPPGSTLGPTNFSNGDWEVVDAPAPTLSAR
jgi:hypothetical protein